MPQLTHVYSMPSNSTTDRNSYHDSRMQIKDTIFSRRVNQKTITLSNEMWNVIPSL
jgi:hypothetical protein